MGSFCRPLRLYRFIDERPTTKDLVMTITRRNVLLGATATAALPPMAARAQTSEVVIGVIYPLC
jgi:branched-chain amino acid transport system substrate-binding protein